MSMDVIKCKKTWEALGTGDNGNPGWCVCPSEMECPEEPLSKNRTFRIREELDRKLQESADRSRRSVSQEIEYRLEQSFEA